jgi:DNA invertase Pin-like site-specific DNA recombinase
MSETYIAYACARVRRAPSSLQEVLDEFAIKRQLRVIHQAARKRRLVRLADRVDVTTTAGTKFVERPAFLHALELARASKATLVIEDVGALFRHLDAESATKCMITLSTLDVPLLEASTQQFLNDIDQPAFLARLAVPLADRVLRADRISKGIKTARAPVVTSAATQRASLRRKQLSRQNAKRLAPTIRGIEAARVDGRPLNANALANALNEREVKAPRGGRWTHDSAARLLKLYRGLRASKGK